MPSPRRGEARDKFISRCMGSSESRSSFPDQKQRAAFCFSQWREKSAGTKKFAAVYATQQRRDQLGQARETNITTKMRHSDRQLEELSYLKSVKPDTPRMAKTRK